MVAQTYGSMGDKVGVGGYMYLSEGRLGLYLHTSLLLKQETPNAILRCLFLRSGDSGIPSTNPSIVCDGGMTLWS